MKLLTINNLNSGYGDVAVLKDVSLVVEEGEVVSIVGANGTGKTTMMNTISGLIAPNSGEIWFDGKRIDKLAPHEITERGVVQVPEGRRVFPFFTIQENLLIGSTISRARKERKRNLDHVYDMLPRLAERKTQVARTLSGGEQQMLAIGRALMAMPKVLMLDEPSLGLSPLLVNTVFDIIGQISKEGTTVVLVEQNVRQALRLSQRAYVLENGHIALEGPADTLLDNPHVKKAYLGL